MMKGMNFFRLSQICFFLFFLTLFFPLRVRLYEIPIFQAGGFHPYTTFFFYLSDLFLLLSLIFLGLWFFLHPEECKNFSLGDRRFFIFWLLFLFIVELSVFFSSFPLATFLQSLRWFEWFFVYMLLINHVIPLKSIFFILVFAMVGESLLALFQYLKQGSVGLSFLGEPFLNPSLGGIATLHLGDQILLRPYGTFPHPNVLGEYFVFAILFLGFFWKKDPLAYSIIAFVLGLGLLFTFSRTSWIALIISGLSFLFLLGKKISSRTFILLGSLFLLFFVTFNLGDIFAERFRFNIPLSFSERYESISESFNLLKKKPFGVGLGISTFELQNISVEKWSPSEYQPPYNLFLVIANELGVQGFILFIIAFFFLGRFIFLERKHHPYFFSFYVAFLIIAFLDHSLFTLFIGQALFTLLLGFWENSIKSQKTVSV